jgi:hypothetical protein
LSGELADRNLDFLFWPLTQPTDGLFIGEHKTPPDVDTLSIAWLAASPKPFLKESRTVLPAAPPGRLVSRSERLLAGCLFSPRSWPT